MVMAFATRSAALLLLRLSLGLIDTAGLAEARPGFAPARIKRRLQAMGTVLGLSVTGPDRAAALAASEAAVVEIGRVEALLTTWRPGGPLDSVNTAPPGTAVVLDAELSNLLETVFEWSERTGGAFDPTVLPLVRAWGLRGAGRIPDEAALARALAATGRGHFRLDAATGRALRLSADAGLDEGAWGKGYALDRAVSALRRGGVEEAFLDLGGQVSAVGRATVAVADPRDRDRPAVTLSVEDASVSTSGNSERGRTVAGHRIGHLLDPQTGRPATDFGSATAVAASGLVADVLSTAFFVLGPEKGLALSETLRREGFPNEALFLVVRGGRLETLASPGLSFQRKEK
jgi:thiamine biosynthesis lipoprotein